MKEAILKKAEQGIAAKSAYLLFMPKKLDVVKDQGFTFYLHYYNTDLLSSLKQASQKHEKDPLLPPFDPNLHVCDTAHHHILINKFMQKQGHIVMSSKEPTAQQGSDLDFSDFTVFSDLLTAFDSQGICYYNSGLASGCSQPHKHLQFVPTTEKPLFDAMIANANLPFVYHSLKLSGCKPEDIGAGYLELMERRKKDKPHEGYNFIVSDNHAVLVPRLHHQHSCGLLVNSIGLCGHLSVWNWSDPMIKTEPMSILRDLCIPK